VWRFLKKLKMELPYDLAKPILGGYSKEISIWKKPFTPLFIAALFPVAKKWKQPQCPLTAENR
jgi:hypothetical protein